MAQKLFDKASLVMIPSQYKEGKIYNIKPEDQSSSFEFERGSAATRVNEDGLIEYVGVGEELVTDGGFDDASAWSTSGGASVSGGKLILDAQNEVAQQLNLGIVSGKEYKVDFTIEGENAHLIVYLGSYSSSNAGSVYTIQSEGAYSIRLDAHTDGDFIKFNCPSSGKNFTVDNVSVRLIENDTPRIDYTNGKALLLEPQRTNEYLNSNDFSLWNTDASVTSTANQLASPDGNINATLMSVTNSGRIYYDPTISTTADRVLSIFIKGGIFNHFRVGLIGSVALVDLINETSSIGDINSIGNGWYRVSLPPTSVSSTSRRAQIQAYPDNTYTNSHGQSGTYYIYGAQLEQGSYATSYIPTNGQTETRLADVCQGGGDASVFNDSEGVLYAEVSRLNGDLSATTIAINKGGSEFSGFSFRTDGKIWAATYNGTSYENISQYTPTDFYDTYKICYKYKSNDFALWVNGVEVDSSVVNTLTLTGLNNLSFSSGTATNKFLGNVRALHYFPEALTDTELQQLTTI